MKLFDAETRPVTNSFVLITAGASILFNCFGAWLIYDDFPAQVFFVALAFGFEGLALMAVSCIIRDWTNNHRAKAAAAGFQLFVIAVICATFGHNAFHRLEVGKIEANKSELARADRIQQIADDYFEEAKAARGRLDANGYRDDATFTRLNAMGESQQKIADGIRAEVKENQPPALWLVLFMLTAAETVKVFGRYTLATHTKKQWSKAQRDAHDKGRAEREDAAAAIEALLKPKRGRPSKAVLAARKLAAAGGHISSAT